MKNLILAILFSMLFLGLKSQSQWSNTGSHIYYNSGNVGIGVTNPFQFKLDIQCNQTDDGIRVTQPNPADNSGIVFRNSSNNYDWSFWNLGNNHAWGGGNFCLFDGNTMFPSPSLFIKRSNGNVGIATEYPLAKLQINVNPAAELRGLVVKNYATNVESFIVQADGTTGIHCAAQPVPGPSGHPGHAFVIVDAIGAPNTWKKNFVVYRDGTVRAREIFVQASTVTFPDYVFKSDYQLLPLSELESYIKTNQHLPNVPSAKSVEKNGIGIGKLTKIQLEKIEELTLYIIELQKQLNTQKQQLESILNK